MRQQSTRAHVQYEHMVQLASSFSHAADNPFTTTRCLSLTPLTRGNMCNTSLLVLALTLSATFPAFPAQLPLEDGALLSEGRLLYRLA